LLRALLGKDLADTLSGIIAQVLGAGLVILGLVYGLLNMAIIGALLFALSPSSLGGGWLSRKKRDKPADAQPSGSSAADG
jgi:hypothetical protein